MNSYYNQFNRQADNYDKNDILSLIKKALRFVADNSGPLADVLDSISILIQAIIDYRDGKYKDFPATAIIGFIASLIYLISPIDVIPDVTPFVGLMDDIAVIIQTVSAFDKYISRYQAWKVNNPDS